MRKIAVIALLTTLTLAVSAKPADACTCNGDACSFLDPIAYALGIGIVGGYAYGTGYFVYRDVTDERQSLEYGATEASVNLALGSMFAAGAVDAFRNDRIGGGLVLSGFTAVHGTLAAHGTWRMYTQRGEFKPTRGSRSTVIDDARFQMAMRAIETGMPAIIKAGAKLERAGRTLGNWVETGASLLRASGQLVADLGEKAVCVGGQIAAIVEATSAIQARFTVSIDVSVQISAAAGATPQ